MREKRIAAKLPLDLEMRGKRAGEESAVDINCPSDVLLAAIFLASYRDLFRPRGASIMTTSDARTRLKGTANDVDATSMKEEISAQHLDELSRYFQLVTATLADRILSRLISRIDRDEIILECTCDMLVRFFRTPFTVRFPFTQKLQWFSSQLSRGVGGGESHVENRRLNNLQISLIILEKLLTIIEDASFHAFSSPSPPLPPPF